MFYDFIFNAFHKLIWKFIRIFNEIFTYDFYIYSNLVIFSLLE